MREIVIRKLKWSAVLFGCVLSLLFAGKLLSVGAFPNLDEETHPDRIQLAQCIADVKEVTQWDENETKKAAVNLCELRKAHAKEKARFQAALLKLNEQYKDATNHGFSQHLPIATNDAWTIVKTCINFKEGFTSPHNVAILNIPEQVHRSCFALGSSLVEASIVHP